MSDFLMSFLQLLFTVLQFAILGRVLMSWVDQGGTTQVARILYDITEPILAPIRSIMPNTGMFDITPIIAMLLLQVIEMLIRSAL